MSFDPRRLGSPTLAHLLSIADEVAAFANAEAAASGLPGNVNGPRDAYRHLIGTAELARRVGLVTGWGMVEFNEFNSWLAMQRALRDGRDVALPNQPESRAMDRHNNALALSISYRAQSPETIVARARRQIERAGREHSGSGHGGTAYWMPRSRWDDPTGTVDWHDLQWPDATETAHFKRYREQLRRRSRRADVQEPMTRTFVDAHMRAGHPVQGHWRSVGSG